MAHHIPLYAAVRYKEIYPGVDLIFYGNGRQLEYDFVIASGADPRRIALAFHGTQNIAIDHQGDLVLQTAAGTVRQPQPRIYQNTHGIRRLIAGGYAVNRERQVTFAISAYGPSYPLIIDPVLSYATYVGGSSYDEGLAIAVDSEGNAYVTGETFSADFPTTAGAFHRTFSPGNDAFVIKVNTTCTALVYATFLGGASLFRPLTRGAGIAVDPAGQAYVVGRTQKQ